MRARFETFDENLDRWLDLAAARQPAPRTGARKTSHVIVRDTARDAPSSSFAKIADVLPPIEAPDGSDARPATSSVQRQTEEPSTIRRSVIVDFLDAGVSEHIRNIYGDATLQGLLVGALTKTIVLLAGRPGVGKSRLAVSLVDEPERRIVVPVASTWRGREDLFGYVNPISGEFEPTAFTNFLHAAEGAEASGDTRIRLVVFEEFNLSPPEHWFSEILVRSQYSPDQREDRTIELGGVRVRGWGDGRTSVYLSPHVRFVGTINIDHTTRQLSPRVLDRAAVIEIGLEPERALQEARVELQARQLEAIRDLNFRLRNTPVMFSLRSALSLRACLDNGNDLGLDTWGAVDLVLTQEVLSKVSLMAADPADVALCDQLLAWSEEYSKELPRCAARITSWTEMLEQGRDIIQA